MRIERDLEKAKQLQKGHGGWNDSMEKAKTKICSLHNTLVWYVNALVYLGIHSKLK